MSIFRTLLVAFIFLPALALAEGKIAVINFSQAIGETAAVQSKTQEMQEDLKDETTKMQKLYDDISEIEQRMQKESMTMSQKEKQDLQDKRQSKMIEFRSLQQMVEKRRQESTQEIMQSMQPKVMQAVRDVAQAEGYDLVVAKEAVLFSKPDMDITNLVTKKLDQMK